MRRSLTVILSASGVARQLHWTIAAAALAFVLPAPANAAQTDPEVIIYRFPGVRDDGGGTSVGVATVFFCTNFSGTQETIRFVTRDFDGTLKTNAFPSVNHLSSLTVVTHFVASCGFNQLSMVTGTVSQGTTAIAATSINVICTAMTIDAANAKPTFAVSLRGIRFNPAPGSQE